LREKIKKIIRTIVELAIESRKEVVVNNALKWYKLPLVNGK